MGGRRGLAWWQATNTFMYPRKYTHLSPRLSLVLHRCTTMRCRSLADNSLTGPLLDCDWLYQSEHHNANFSKNDVTAPRTPKYTGLQVLNVSGNQLSGRLPSKPCRATNLSFARNRIWGALPKWIATLEFGIDLSHNQIEGVLRPWFCSLSTAGSVDLSYNNLEGTLPSCLGSVRAESLNLGSNEFQGTVPSSYFSEVQDLIISNNDLSGTIPGIMGNRTAPCDMRGNTHLCVTASAHVCHVTRTCDGKVLFSF